MTLVGDKEATRDYRLLEVGCGAGNALFPLVESNSNPRLHLHGSDYSEQAVEVVKVCFSFIKRKILNCPC